PSNNRWGDYSALSVDPADDCTFWYTNEYYPSSSVSNWQTRIGSFNLCADSPPEVTIVAPPDGSSITQSLLIGFLGTASDDPDGDLAGSLSWESSMDGNIGSGGQFQTTLSLGSHTITASVTDSDSQEGTHSINLTITATGCSDQVALNQEIGDTQTIEARVGIGTWPGFSVTSAGSATLRAGDSVVMRDGSAVAAAHSTTLKAEIVPGLCP
ncbi:MAG: hypothetical protein ACE5EG_02900, partial [Thermoanaerobaculia bacterium]